VTSSNIAKILNIYPRKGAVAVGADADLVVFDPKKKKTISAKTQASAIDYNVFEGFEVEGLPRYTLSRGEVVFEDGKIKAEDGRGKFIERPPNQAVSQALSSWKALTTPQPVERSAKNMPAGV
jgi:dihydropyrimidinase